MLTVLTPTCDRPAGLALAERWMARQSTQPDEWIVADGGSRPATCRARQIHIHRRDGGVGANNFVRNLLAGLDAVHPDCTRLIFWEDDDWYAADHLAATLALLDGSTAPWIVGDPVQRYYNVGIRRYRCYPNKGAALSQTGLAAAAFPHLRAVLTTCLTAASYGVDGRLWVPMLIGQMCGILSPMQTVVGIKGLPGQVGLGVGHRPAIIAKWTADPALTTLREWIGADADVYAAHQQRQGG